MVQKCTGELLAGSTDLKSLDLRLLKDGNKVQESSGSELRGRIGAFAGVEGETWCSKCQKNAHLAAQVTLFP